MKVVLDTNIWISGLMLPKSSAGKIIASWRSDKFVIVTSHALLNEIKKVLSYPKIAKRIQWDETKIDTFLLELQFFTDCILINNIDPNIFVKRDRNDDKILHTFIASHADYLVTGDNDLLALSQDYPIITLAEFCSLLF